MSKCQFVHLHSPQNAYSLPPLQFLDHVYFVHPSTEISADISTDSRPMYWSRVGRYVGRYMSVDLSTDVHRPSDGRHIDRLSADISVDIAADTRPICRPLTVGGVSVDCRWYIGRVSYNISQNLRLSVTDVYKAVASLRRRR